MELLDTVITTTVVMVVGVMLGFFVNGRFKELRQELAGLRDEVRDLRSDLTHVALAVGARKKPNSG